MRTLSHPLTLGTLEERVVPAVGDLFISEVHFGPLFGDNNKHQYVELRGEPGAVIANGTYFVTVDGDGPNDAGKINSVFDLSNLQLGSNGYLVILQGGGNYAVDPAANKLQGTDGFGGLPGDIFSDNSTRSNRFEFIFGSNTFMLIEAPTAPVPNDDVDSNNDGVLDGAGAAWTVLDSVGVLGTFVGGNAAHIGYGQINFAVDGLGQFPAGSTVVNTDTYSHVARVGESTGFQASDWVAGRTTEEGNNTFLFRYEAGIFGNPSQRVYAGRALDHLGTSNFVASIDGTSFVDTNSTGTFEPGVDTPLPGVTIFADRNGNGQLDDFTVTFEPDDFAAGTELTNALNGVTLSSANDQNEQSGRPVTASTESGGNVSTGDRVFGRGGITFWTPSSRLRADFYKPVRSVSLDFINSSTLSDGVGQLDAFSRDGTLLESFQTQPFRNGVRTMTITRASADIAFVTAHSAAAGTPFGRLDRLVFTAPEDTAVAGPDGSYSIDLLQDGDYTLRLTGLVGGTVTTPAGGVAQVTIADLVPIDGLDFGTVGGTVPGVPPGVPGVPPVPGAPPPVPGIPPPVLPGGGFPPLPIVRPTEQSGMPFFSVGSGPGGPPEASVFTPDGQLVLQVTAFDPLVDRGGLRTAVADVTGDGTPDLITVSGPGGPVEVHVYDGTTGLRVRSFQPFEASFTGGALVAAGDINGDGAADIVITPDLGGGPRVRAFDGRTGNPILDFFGIEDPNFRGGARAALGDLNGDGTPDLIVAAGFGGGPRVAIFDGNTLDRGRPRKMFPDFFAFEPALTNGVFVTAGDVSGNGTADLIFGGGPGGGPRVLIISGSDITATGARVELANFFAADPNIRTGVRVAAKDFDADGRADLVTGSGTSSRPLVTTFTNATLVAEGDPVPAAQFEVFGPTVTGGIFVG